jgi:hypothetical protein
MGSTLLMHCSSSSTSTAEKFLLRPKHYLLLQDQQIVELAKVWHLVPQLLSVQFFLQLQISPHLLSLQFIHHLPLLHFVHQPCLKSHHHLPFLMKLLGMLSDQILVYLQHNYHLRQHSELQLLSILTTFMFCTLTPSPSKVLNWQNENQRYMSWDLT